MTRAEPAHAATTPQLRETSVVDDSRDGTIEVLRRAREYADCFVSSPVAALSSVSDTHELFVRLITEVELSLGVASLVDWYWGPDDDEGLFCVRDKSEVLAAFDATIARLEGGGL